MPAGASGHVVDGPDDELHVIAVAGNGLSAGACSMQGWREEMEVRHAALRSDAARARGLRLAPWPTLRESPNPRAMVRMRWRGVRRLWW